MAKKKITVKEIPELKTNPESLISIVLGGLIVLLIGFFVFQYFTGLNKGKKPFFLSLGQKATVTPSSIKPADNFKVIPKSYTVKEGDDLWQIAEFVYNDGYKWMEISNANNLTNPDQIETGMVLKLPQLDIKIGNVDAQGAAIASPNAISGEKYTVVEGDFLWDIAVRACGDGYKWPQIANDNKLENPDLIHPGNVLVIKCK